MKTIEERAQKYAHKYRRDTHDLKGERADAVFVAYCQGAEDEYKELLCWHDPKEELPKKHHRVLLKVNRNGYVFIEVGSLQATDDGVRFIFSDCDDCEVIGWREIHE